MSYSPAGQPEVPLAPGGSEQPERVPALLQRFVQLVDSLLTDETDPPGKRAVTQALCLLELGRGVLLSQALDTRNDLKDLRARDNKLAERFEKLG